MNQRNSHLTEQGYKKEKQWLLFLTYHSLNKNVIKRIFFVSEFSFEITLGLRILRKIHIKWWNPTLVGLCYFIFFIKSYVNIPYTPRGKLNFIYIFLPDSIMPSTIYLYIGKYFQTSNKSNFLCMNRLHSCFCGCICSIFR